MGNLGRYSFRNQLYILSQMPEATTVYGLRKWNTLGRTVRKGERSLRVFSPIRGRKDGEEEEKPVIKGFRLGYVFDISQTEGDEIESFIVKNGVVEDKDLIISAMIKVAEKQGYKFNVVDDSRLGAGCYGLCNHRSKEILILEKLGDSQFISTFAHELGHALAHSRPRGDLECLCPKEKREIKEVEAESIACIVCSYLSLDTENFNFSYILGWAEGDISKFRRNIDFVGACAKTIIDEINLLKIRCSEDQ